MNCPTNHQIDQLLRQNLPAEQHHLLQDHVDQCALCQARLDQITAVPVDVAQQYHLRSTPMPPVLKTLIDRLQAEGPESLSDIDDSPEDLPQLEHYSCLRQIASGGSGTLYQARDTKLNRIVAIKLLHSSIQLDSHANQRIRREAQAIAALDHTNIVRLYDVSRSATERPFLVLEYVPGETLSDRLDREPMLTLREAAAIAMDVANALYAAHQASLVHRDVKPSNILLDGSRVKLTDFGLVLDVDVNTRLTEDGILAGTPHYMSPEQIQNSHYVDHRTDIYSLGVVLYEMLTGQLPFHGVRRMLLVQILHDEPIAIRKLNDQVSRDLETICQKAMAKEPAKRYGTAQDLANDLQCWLQNRPITARPISKFERCVRWYKRNPRIAGLTTIVVLLLMALVLGSIITANRLRMLRNTANQQRDIAFGSLQSLVYDIYDRLDEHDDPVTYRAQREILQTALDGLDRMPASPELENQIRWTRMAALVRLGGIRYQLDDDEQAESDLKDAIAFGESLGFGSNQSDRIRYERVRPFSYAHYYLGAIALGRQDFQEASVWFRKSLDFDEPLVAASPQNLEYQIDLISSLLALTDVHVQLGKLPEAKKYAVRCQQTIDSAVKLDSDNEFEIRESFVPDLLKLDAEMCFTEQDYALAKQKLTEAQELLSASEDGDEVVDSTLDTLLSKCNAQLILAARKDGHHEEAERLLRWQAERFRRLRRWADGDEDDEWKQSLMQLQLSFENLVAP